MVIPMHNLIECSDNCSNTPGSLWLYYRNKPDDEQVTDSESFKFKINITGSIPANGDTEDFETVVPLKYSSNF